MTRARTSPRPGGVRAILRQLPGLHRRQRGNPHAFQGIYKKSGEPLIYASDRNGGLYVLKEYGAGSKKKGKK